MNGGLEGALATALNIRRGEARRTALMFLYQLAIVSAFIVGRTARDTLFLSRHDLKQLPLMYVGVAVSVSVSSITYARLSERWRRDVGILFFLIGCAVIMVGAFALLTTDSAGSWFYPALYLFVEIVGAISMIQFWTYANEIFSAREAKRLFAIIGAGGVVASVLCGFIIASAAKKTGAEPLVLLVALLLLGGAASVRAIQKSVDRPLEPKRKAKAAPGTAKPAEALPLRHLRLIAGIVCLTMLTSTIVDYQFKVIARSAFVGHEDALASYFGYFYGFAGVVSFFVQFFAIGRLLERAGIVAALLVLPIGLLSGAAGLIFMPVAMALTAATLAKGAENVFRYTVNDASMQLLYVPLSASVRARAKTLIDGMVKPISVGTSGVLILLLGPIFAGGQDGSDFAHALAWLDVALIAGWVTLVISIRSEYVRSLLGTLRARRLDFSSPFSLATDEASVRVLKEALRSEKDTDVAHALELLPSLRVDLSADLARLAVHPSPEIRIACLEHLGKSGRFDYMELIRSRMADVDPKVRAAAVEAICAKSRERAIREVRGFLKDRSAVVRGAAVSGMFKHGGLDGVLAGAETLKSLFADPDPQARIQGAHVLEATEVRSFYQPVLVLLQDPSLEVVAAAISAAGAMKSPELAPSLIYKLGNPRTAKAAARALTAMGESVVPLLTTVLRNTKEQSAIRREVPRILSKVGGPDTLKVLLERLDETDPVLLLEITRAAARIREKAPNVMAEDPRLSAAMKRELLLAYQSLAVLVDLGVDPSDLLGEALLLRQKRRLALAFRILSIRYSTRTIELIFANLDSESRALRHNAVELIDNLLPREESKLILPLIEEHTLEERVALGVELFPLERRPKEAWLKELIGDPDPWIATAAIHSVGSDAMALAVLERPEPHDPLVLEAGCRSLTLVLEAARSEEKLSLVERFLERALASSHQPVHDAAELLRAGLHPGLLRARSSSHAT
ncbi:MAG: Npt1/Npt2 family nucleotide transporter [Myxococcota bacterium]